MIKIGRVLSSKLRKNKRQKNKTYWTNKTAWSKIGSACPVSIRRRHLMARTSLEPSRPRDERYLDVKTGPCICILNLICWVGGGNLCGGAQSSFTEIQELWWPKEASWIQKSNTCTHWRRKLFSVHLEQLANLAQFGAFQIGTVTVWSFGLLFSFSISCIGQREGNLSTKNQHSSWPGALFQKIRSSEKCIL